MTDLHAQQAAAGTGTCTCIDLREAIVALVAEQPIDPCPIHDPQPTADNTGAAVIATYIEGA